MLPCGTIWWKATEVTAGLVESTGSLLPIGWLKVTCGLTACRTGLVPGPVLGNECGKTFFTFTRLQWGHKSMPWSVRPSVCPMPGDIEWSSWDIYVVSVAVAQPLQLREYSSFPRVQEAAPSSEWRRPLSAAAAGIHAAGSTVRRGSVQEPHHRSVARQQRAHREQYRRPHVCRQLVYCFCLIGGLMEVGASTVRMGWRPAGLLAHLPPLSSHAS